MRNTNLKAVLMLIVATFTIISTTTSCSKSASKPTTTNPDPGGDGGTDPHVVDPKLVGTWMWSEAADGAYYDEDGTYEGPAYGLALEYKINANGSGTAFNHFSSTIGAGTSMIVDISSEGFFESDNDHHFGYFPLSGKYESSLGTYRDLSGPAELWDESSSTGKSYLYQKLEFKTVNGRQCFEVTSSDGTVDRYWKVE